MAAPTSQKLEGLPFTSSPQGSLFPPSVSDLPVIPPEHHSRTLVLCFDGTGEQFEADNSNVVQFFSLLHKGDHTKQLVYYQPGIGTYESPQIATPLMAKLSMVIDEAIAWNLHAHVMGGYEFLMENYTTGDRICIFGFSRGAYTARSLAGMIHKVGLLPACNFQQIPFAYKMYTRNDEIGWKQSNAFKKTFSIDVDIEFIGVWDTVNSVGVIPKRLPFTTSNTIVRTFRHALSLDERRAKFKANLWNRPTARESVLSYTDQKIQDDKLKTGNHAHAHENGSKMSQKALERKWSKEVRKPTDIEEVWFAGCHCDVGGGSVDNETTTNLARIPLRWMVRQCFKTETGIMFNTEGLRSIGLDPTSLFPLVKPRPPALPVGGSGIRPIPMPTPKSKTVDEPDEPTPANAPNVQLQLRKTEEELDLEDALSPLYDALSLPFYWPWWILEFLPIRQRYQRGDNKWMTYLGWNMGRGRFIPKQKTLGVKVHRSVKMRLEALHEDGRKYEPRAKFDLTRTTWVD
ncbi:hypothetical protein FB45DRAFT_935001 [Roridomyces roridus]|uniref:T6SS Phospholipase effector Tle1-like catalytic domain-containing protein n=1 Tax=Roridomyces roridus TaxID=1738132 RepID=A0AAD7BBH4_9AGAR|nr:hypothetical protein FB45DRAFT_935001 [Roridomyces roridus]